MEGVAINSVFLRKKPAIYYFETAAGTSKGSLKNLHPSTSKKEPLPTNWLVREQRLLVSRSTQPAA
ncbi:hypothetical protein [Desulfitobacterium hafniense]|uniref:Uncharacterized protein n=1 Tax=Desulfitobacterium hafniense DP7 TaxID=537010 RepID=G9XIC8_DESHA|nr:hypothetical protein [Desulfitobacterium hafniense]EHL08611.1 hypothetical protein HMPREF0322_00704 [Desulfitobacterium hafniense DP7]